MIESEHRFREMANAAPVLIWESGPDKGCTFFNQGWLEFTGRRLEQELGDGWTAGVHPEDLAGCLEIYASSFDRRLPFEMQYRLRHASGEYRWVTDRGAPSYAPDGTFRGFIGAAIDIHRERLAIESAEQATAEAQRASQAKDEFLAALSHELRTPLTPILLVSEELESEESLTDSVRRRIALIRRNVELEARLIDDLLDLTSIVRGKLTIQRGRVDLHQLIRQCEELLAANARATDVRVELYLEAGNHWVLGDATRLQQVVLNVLSNSIKFSRTGGRVLVRTWNEGWTMHVSIRDYGHGIPPEHLRSIFQPFDQGPLTGRHRFGGLGLGLAISHAIVGLHGGVIAAESEGLGRGAEITIELPCRAAPVSPPVPGAAPEAATCALRILLVEDHLETLNALHRLLVRDGHVVFPAQTFAQSLDLASQHKLDVLVSDLGLPDGSGYELMETLAGRYRVRGIAMSGYGTEDDRARSQEAGFAAHLTKPVPLDRLREQLRALGQSG